MSEGVKTLKAVKALKAPNGFPPGTPQLQVTGYRIPGYRLQVITGYRLQVTG